MNTFGERLKSVRESRELTKKQLAEALKVTERNYYRYEVNESTPTFERFLAMIKYLDTSADYLLGLSDSPKRK